MYARILIGLAGVLLLVAAAVYHLASSVVGERHAFAEQARQWAAQRTSITQIDEIDEYRGNQAYTVVIGKNQMGVPCIAWMTPDKVVFDTLDRAVSRDSVRQAVEKGFKNARIVHITPGIDGDSRFWEAVFVDESGRYNYVYYDLYTGKVQKSYRLNPVG